MKKIKFIGFTPGPFPAGREALFALGELVLSRQGVKAAGLEVPREEEAKLNDSLWTWDNSAPCEDVVRKGFAA